jgi:hypothetical protein
MYVACKILDAQNYYTYLIPKNIRIMGTPRSRQEDQFQNVCPLNDGNISLCSRALLL